jgi:hypothetical protein
MFKITAPLRGQDFQRLIPDGSMVEFQCASVLSGDGFHVIGNASEFDTCVTTERSVVPLEERLAQIERRQLTINNSLRNARRDKLRLEKELENALVEPVGETVVPVVVKDEGDSEPEIITPDGQEPDGGPQPVPAP